MFNCCYTMVRACLQLFIKNCSSFMPKYFRMKMVRCCCWALSAYYFNTRQLCCSGSSLNTEQ